MARTKGIAEEFQDLLAIQEDEFFKELSPIAQRVHLTAEMLDCIQAIAEQFQDTDDETLVSELTDVAQKYFEAYVVPYDVPGLNSLTESWLESAVSSQVIPPAVKYTVEWVRSRD